ncbi:MAG: hypothetical protein HFH74_06640 [Lachnospiraceae bacterium]|nr:hypothetical protein [Lachnospiraceae bacterium]
MVPFQIPIILSAKDIQEIDTGFASGEISILNKISKIILFQCANAMIARRYSELIGNYLRQFESYSYNEGKGLLEILIGHGEKKRQRCVRTVICAHWTRRTCSLEH